MTVPTESRPTDLSKAELATKPKVRLPLKVQVFFSVGHFFNDLSISVWFAYTMIYFQLIQFSGQFAAALILVGQAADALATPLVGWLSDWEGSTKCAAIRWYGKRKSWHFIGSVMVAVSFPFVYNDWMVGASVGLPVKFAYYAVMVSVWQVGWAAVQVAHVALITDLTEDPVQRIRLNAYRQAFTVLSSILVYAVMLIALGFQGGEAIKSEDSVKFTNVVYIITAIGLVFTLLFHVYIKENSTDNSLVNQMITENGIQTVKKSLEKQNSVISNCESNQIPNLKQLANGNPETGLPNVQQSQVGRSCWDWLKEVVFYKVGFIYIMARLFVNLTQVYTPLYLQNTLNLPKQSIAIIPFVTYVSGFIFSLAIRMAANKIGPKTILTIGCVVGLSSGIWILLGDGHSLAYRTWQIYGIASLIGVGGTTMLIASLAVITGLIGSDSANGAFVFGAIGFFDKLLNGIVVVVLEQFNEPVKVGEVQVSNEYYQQVLVYVTASATLLTGVCLLWTRKRKSESKDCNYVTKM